MEFLLGKVVSDRIKDEIKQKIQCVERVPFLAILLNENDESSKGYVNTIVKNCELVGIKVHVFKVEQTLSAYLNLLDELNNDDLVDAILVTRPLSKNIDENKVLSRIDKRKDVDGICKENLGNMLCGNEKIVPNTARAIMELLEHYNIDLKGKKVLVVGRSLSVGKPAAMMLLNRHATVTIAHSRSENLNDELKNYDIVIAAVGKPHILDGKNMKEGSIVIDAGIHYLNDVIVGDVKPHQNIAKISKVPGGVGAITTACLLRNVINCYEVMCDD